MEHSDNKNDKSTPQLLPCLCLSWSTCLWWLCLRQLSQIRTMLTEPVSAWQ